MQNKNKKNPDLPCMHPDITNSWIPGKNEMHFLLPTFRRVIFRLCLLSMEGSALWQCTDTERLSTPVFLIIPFGVYAVSLFFSLSSLGVLADSGLTRCSVCQVEFFFPLMAARLSSFCFFLYFSSLVIGCTTPFSSYLLHFHFGFQLFQCALLLLWYIGSLVTVFLHQLTINAVT